MALPTVEFAVCLAALLAVHWSLHSATARQALLWVASILFYATWEPRAVAAFAAVIVLTAGLARLIPHYGGRSRRWLVSGGVVSHLVLLGWLKYQGFVASVASSFLGRLGMAAWTPVADVALPVGLSFLCFRSISYLIDVHQERCTPASWLAGSLFLGFFPYLLAGPLVRPGEFFPQLAGPSEAGTRTGAAVWLIGSGLLKKVLIANPLQIGLVDPVFAAPNAYSMAEAWLATYAYAVQIYCDFSAYSDMAIGVAVLLGIRTPSNFDAPYSACSLREFWRRWHITLSAWLRDYLYIPLGGSRHGASRTALNLFLTMLLGGLWHGAGWTYVLWGAWHGCGLVAERWWNAHVQAGRRGACGRALARLLTFHFVWFGWILFRAEELATAREMMLAMCGSDVPSTLLSPVLVALLVAGLALHMLPVEPLHRAQQRIQAMAVPVQALLLALALALVRVAWPEGVAPFIYARF